MNPAGFWQALGDLAEAVLTPRLISYQRHAGLVMTLQFAGLLAVFVAFADAGLREVFPSARRPVLALAVALGSALTLSIMYSADHRYEILAGVAGLSLVLKLIGGASVSRLLLADPRKGIAFVVVLLAAAATASRGPQPLVAVEFLVTLLSLWGTFDMLAEAWSHSGFRSGSRVMAAGMSALVWVATAVDYSASTYSSVPGLGALGALGAHAFWVGGVLGFVVWAARQVGQESGRARGGR